MKAILIAVAASGLSIAANPCLAQEHHISSYAGEQTRAIKSLSKDDIAALEQGTGWGLALAAELNHVPGPRHVLDMSSEIVLDEAQVSAISDIYDEMKADAIRQGAIFISLEAELDRRFRDDTVTDAILRSSVDEISKARGDLRYIHLVAHLKTADVLSVHQIKMYNKLRGYYGDDLCSGMPDGHDPGMWREHNGCDAYPQTGSLTRRYRSDLLVRGRDRYLSR